MNSMQISCFLEAAKHSSFSKAAAQLFISQPSFSRNISSLEEELGITLFYRNSFNGIQITEGGKLVAEALTRARKDIAVSVEKAKKIEQNQKLSLTLGMLESQFLDTCLEKLFTEFRLQHPNITFHIKRSTYKDLMNALQSEEIDLVFMPEWQYTNRQSLSIHYIEDVETILVVPKRLFPAPENRIYSLCEFQSFLFINLNSEESLPARELMLNTFQKLNISPPIYEAQSIQEQIHKVEMGEGVIMIGPDNAICYSPNVHCIKIKELVSQPFAFAWRKNSPPEGVVLFHRFLQNTKNTNLKTANL